MPSLLKSIPMLELCLLPRGETFVFHPLSGSGLPRQQRLTRDMGRGGMRCIGLLYKAISKLDQLLTFRQY